MGYALNWSNIFHNYKLDNCCNKLGSTAALDKLITQHAAIFGDQLDIIKGLKAKLHVQTNAKPKYCKARNVPFALTKAVENELDRLENNGIIKSISSSEWASPVVIVPKPDGTIRLCGDYKSTINPVIENEMYPQPRKLTLLKRMHR